MDWSKGFSARYQAYIVDTATWRDGSTVEIVEGTIDRKANEDLRESADITVADEIQADSYIRIYIEARQEEGDPERVPIFTGIISSPETAINGTRKTYSLECYSVLKPSADILLERGWYVPATVEGGKAIQDLLSVGPVNVEVDGITPKLAAPTIAEDGETRLSMALKILNIINWRLTITGDGIIHIRPESSGPVQTFGLERDVIKTEVTVKKDYFSAPNVYRVVASGVTAIARDDDPNSPLSTASRGREVWAEDSSTELADGESAADQARQKLREAQNIQEELSYTRRFDPDVVPGDIVRIHYPGQDLDGNYRVTSQSIQLGAGAETTEEATVEH